MKRLVQALAIAGLVAAPFVATAKDDLLRGLLQVLPQAMAPTPAPTPAPGNGTAPRPAESLLQALLAGNTSEAQEREIGRQIAGNVLGAAPLVADPALQRYVNRVGRWVASQSERPDLAWSFGVIESENINAFAAPGGYILVTKGLYRQLNNEAELAGVLAHEIGHVIRRHHLKLLQQSHMVSAIGGLLGQKVKGQGQIVQNIIGNGAEIVARSLDKDAEHEADRIGMVLAARAGYDAYALPAVLQSIGHLPAQDSRTALLFKTHPHPEDRIAHLAAAVEAAGDTLPSGKLVEGRLYRIR